MKSTTFKYFLDGKEITKTQAQNMFDTTTFTIKDGGVYFTTTVTPVSKFFSGDFQKKVEERLDLAKQYREKFIEDERRFLAEKEDEIFKSLEKEIADFFTAEKPKTDDESLEFKKVHLSLLKQTDKLLSSEGFPCQVDKEIEQLEKEIKSAEKENKIETFNSTRHKYNPNSESPKFSRNVQDALQRAEEHQAQFGRKKNKTAERFGDIYWGLRPTTEEEEKVITDLERKTFDGKAYEKDKALNGWDVEEEQRNSGKGISQYDTREAIDNKDDWPLGGSLRRGEIITYEKNSDKAVKHSKGKLFYELDWSFITQMAERMASNKKEGKYELFNWKQPMTPKGIDDLKQATLRHLLEVLQGKYEDDGKEFGHISAIACNSMMIFFQLINNEK